MKRKLLFITLLMLFCTTMFGQQHWTMSNSDIVDYPLNTTVTCSVTIEGQVPENITDLEIGAFHNNVLRGVAKPVSNGFGGYIVYLTVYSGSEGEIISFKLYNPATNKEYDTDYTIGFSNNIVGDLFHPVQIDFYSMHWSYNNNAENYMAYPCVIKIDGVIQNNPNLEIAAFINNELCGVAKPALEPNIGIYMATLQIYGTNGQTINFKLFDPSIGENGAELETVYTETYNYDYNGGIVEIDFRNEAVAQIGSNYYATLQEALKAITSDCTLDILKDITIASDWDCRNTGAKIGVPVTINGNGKTINFTGKIYDANWNTLFRFEDVATVKNLTLDASAATDIQRGITFKTSVTVDNCTLIGNGTTARYAVIVGEGAGTDIDEVTANITNSTFKDWIIGVTDNMNGQDMKEFAITGCTFDNTDVIISAYEEVTFTGNTTNSDVQITSYTANNTLNVTAKNNNLAADGTYTVNAGGTLDLQDEFLTPVADVNGKIYFTLQDALNYAVTAADEVTVTLLDNINLEGKTWTPVYFNSYIAGGTNTLIIDGKDKTISNLTDMLFSGTWTGTKLEVKNLTISKANIKHDVDDANNVGVGAIVGNISATDEVVFNNVKLVESHVEGGHWTGGLIGYAAGYSGNDGPVFTDIVIKNCEISGSTIVGKGSVGGVVGHATGDAWTSFGVETTTISNNTITSTGSSVNKAGIVMGTIGAAGTEQTTNNISHTGGVFVSVTESGNTATSNGTAITRIYGRQGSSTGILTLTKGGSYQNNPIEENVAYAVVAPGFKLEQNTNGTYGVVVDPEYGKQAKIVKDGTTTYYTTIADAITAAQPGETVTILDGEYTTDVTINKAITVVGERDEQGNNLVKITGRVSAYTGATVKCLNVNNTKTGDYDCALNVNGKDIVVDGVNLTGHNTMRYCYANGNITIKNSTINGSYFAVHFDGSEGGNIAFENTDITGWVSYASTVNSVSYTYCDIDQGDYSGHRYYNKNIRFTECGFAEGFKIELIASGSNVAFTDADMTVADVKALFKDPYYVANGNVTLNNVQVTYAASGYTANGSKYFDNLQDAINEVINGGYITVRSNIELTQGVTVPAGKKITLGLNGYTITGTPTEAAAFAVITNNGNLTIDDTQNGKILCNHTLAGSTSYAVNTITNLNGGVLTVAAGTIENKSTYTSSNQIGYAIDNYSGATVVIKGGKVTASGSVYYDGIRQFCNSETLENNVTIEDGEVSTLWIQNPSNDNVTAVKGSFDITGGTLGNLYLEPSANFSGSISDGHVGSISRHQSGDNDIVSFITGGTFGMDVTEFCAFNYVCTPNGNGTYGIVYKPQEDNAFVIETLHELEAFRDAVNAGNTFSGQTVVLSGDVNLAVTRAINNWEPIGTQANPFKGTFDGGNKTISNLVVEGENYLGLFGKTNGATIKNVKINNVTINGVAYLGAIVGMGYTGTIDNCHVTGNVEIAGNYMVGGINGQGYATVNNSSVVANDNSFVKAIHGLNNNEGDNVGGIVGHCGETNTLTANTVKNITISGTRKVGGIVGIANQGTKVENCVVEDVTIETSATKAYANDNITTMSIGALIGQYQNSGSAGTVKDCMVKNVEFNNVNDVNVSVGPITGGSRGGTDGMLAPTGVTASNNNIYMSTITGSNNLYLMDPVAKIGETEYYTLFDAVAAVQDGETKAITMLRNTAEEFAIDNTTANITLDMAGFTLTGAITPSKANLTIENGTINNENASYSAIEINEGSLVLNYVKVTSKRHGVRIDGPVTATIDGGTYKSAIGEGTGTYHALNIGNKTSQVVANVTITAGTFVGPKGTTADSGSAVNVQTGSTVTIEGGDFSGGKNATLGVSGEMIVKGGRFDQDPSAYLADAYTVNIENEMYVVRYTPIMVTYPVGNPVYPEGKVEYYSDMLEAVPYTTNCPRLEGATITLLADVSGAGMRFMENDMVFDLNGHTYTITAGTGSQGTNTSGFQIRPEVTTNVLFKNGTIKVAEGAPVVWMFNCYATDFIVEDVTVDCSNMAYSYGESCYVVVSREGDNVQLTGETKIVNFKSDVAGNAINVGGTMTIGEEVDLGVNAVIKLGGGAQLTAPAGLNVVTVDGYMVVYENGVYKSVKVVAQVGENKFGSVIAALNHAIANNEAQVKIVSDSRELMPTDVELILNADLEITAAQPYTVKFYNNGTSYDFVLGSNNNNTFTIGENVTFQLEDRVIWMGYYGNNVDVVVKGTLAAYQIWHGADTQVTLTGTIKTTGEAFVMRRGATLTVNGGKVNANYFNILAGNILAENAEITCGAMWIANEGNYANEGNANISIKSSKLISTGNLKSSTSHANGVSINFENSEVTFVLFDGYGVSSIDANTVLNIKGENAEVSIVGLTNNGLVNVTEKAKPTLTGTVTNNGAMKIDATSVIYAPENLGVTIDDNDYDVVYENGAYQAVHKPFVAEVDGTQFTSLQGAFEAVQDNGTITLLRDVTFDLTTVGYQDENWVDGVRYNGDKSFTVNFNTYKVTDNGCVNDYLININNKGEKDNEITFTNGTIESANGCWATVCVGAESSTHKTVLNLNVMNIINENDASYSGNLAVRVRGTADVNTTVNVNTGTTITSDGASYGIAPSTNGAVVNINAGATIIQKNSGTSGGNSVFAAVGGKGTVNIYDGAIISSDRYGVHTMTTGTPVVNIYGGTITAEVALKASTNGGYGQSSTINVSGGMITGALEEYTDNAQIILTGGTFSTDVNEYCHEYYDAIQGADNLWRVEKVLFAQTTALQGGWNWFSSYVDLSTPDGLGKLQTALDGNGVQIKTQGNQFSFYQNNQWNSSAGFTSLYNEKMYMIQTTNDVNVELIGSVIDYANTVIVLNKGWNWISYPLDVNTEVNEALKNMSPSDGDIIKGYGDNTTSVYYTSDDPATPSEWWPSIELNPGQGYMYKSNTNTSFRYAAGNGTSAKVDSRDNNYWVAAKSQYANNMTIIAMLSIDNEIVKGDYEIAAFANGECRGSARPIYNEYLDAYILLLTVFGDDVEELTFKYYDIDADTEYELSNVMNYSNDAIVGTIDNPYIFSMNILGIGENSIDNINIYPNPTTTDREINLQAICDKVEVFNALGVKVAEYHNVDTLDAFETAGIYVIRITNDNAVKHCRLVVK